MRKYRFIGIVMLLVFALALVACGGDDDAESDASGSATGEIPDLEGREVTIAIENQYLPYNYIDITSGEAEGWDYDAWRKYAIC